MEVLFVLNNQKLPLSIRRDMTIGAVKEALAAKHAAAAGPGLRFFKAGAVLQDAKKVKDYGIKAGDGIIVGVGSGGGGATAGHEGIAAPARSPQKAVPGDAMGVGAESARTANNSETLQSLSAASATATGASNAAGADCSGGGAAGGIAVAAGGGAGAARALAGRRAGGGLGGRLDRAAAELPASPAGGAGPMASTEGAGAAAGGAAAAVSAASGSRGNLSVEEQLGLPAKPLGRTMSMSYTGSETEERRKEERAWKLRQQQSEANLLGLDLPPGAGGGGGVAGRAFGNPLAGQEEAAKKDALAAKLNGKRYFCPITNEAFQTWEEMAAHLLALRELMDEEEAQNLASELSGKGDAALAEVVLGQRAIGEGGGGAGSAAPAAQPVSAAEANVNAAIERIERLQAFADDCKQRYNSDECATSYSAQQSQLDAVYLFVKDKMRGTQDFAQEGPNIDNFLAVTFTVQASSLLPLLLEWLLVEEEVQAMQKYLNDCIMGGDSSALEECALWQRSIDETSGALYYCHVETGESRWDEPPSIVIVPANLTSAIYAMRLAYQA